MNLRSIAKLLVVSICIVFNSSCSFSQTNNEGAKMDDDKERFIRKLLRNNWKEKEKVLSLVEPAILFNQKKTARLSGGSKFGGAPEMPDNLSWPTYNGLPMVFLAQINLEEIGEVHKDNRLPAKGILYFFCYFKPPLNEYGAEYEFLPGKDQYKVLFFDGERSKLKQVPFPSSLTKQYHFTEQPLSFHLTYQVPNSLETYPVEKVELTKADELLYQEFVDDECEHDMMLGTPCPVQYGADYDWAYSSIQVKDYNDPGLAEKVKPIRAQFVNLLSFSMEKRFDGIGGSVAYFGIRLEDLKKANFENVILIFQDT